MFCVGGRGGANFDHGSGIYYQLTYRILNSLLHCTAVFLATILVQYLAKLKVRLKHRKTKKQKENFVLTSFLPVRRPSNGLFIVTYL